MSEKSIFDDIFEPVFSAPVRRDPIGPDRRAHIGAVTNDYLRDLDGRDLSPDQVRNELCTIFKHVRAECEAYGRRKPRIRMSVLRILKALDEDISAKQGEFLLAKWKNWEDMLNPASRAYSRINLPGSMISENYVVFEDLIPIREYFDKHYHDGSFARKSLIRR